MSNDHETNPTKGVPMTSATAEAPLAAEGGLAAAYGVLFSALMRRGSADWTVAELDALGLDEHVRVEIDNGSLLVSPFPTNDHQDVASQIEMALRMGLG